MIAFAREFVYEVRGEVGELLQLHYEELTLNKDRIKLNPMWAEYGALEVMGRFVVFTARDDGKLVGYSAFFVNKHMHYADLVHAHNDVLFLHPEHRKGSTGIRLIDLCEGWLQEAGAHKVTYHSKLDKPLIKILHRRGYKTEELVLGKLL